MIKNYKQVLTNLLNGESGQDLIEYALVAAIIAIGAVTAMGGLGNSIGNAFNIVGNSLSTSTT